MPGRRRSTCCPGPTAKAACPGRTSSPWPSPRSSRGALRLQIDVKERAFKAHLAEENELRAAYVALDLAHDYGYAGKPSIASAWARRGERLLEGQPESYANGYLALLRSDAASAAGNVDAALELAEQAVEIATRAADADLQAAALTNLGALKIATGATSDGMALMEEASISAVNGELSPFATGVTCCTMIAACRDLTDYRRATRVDGGNREVLRAPVGLRLPRRLPDPSRGGRRPERRLGSRRAGAPARGRRTERVQRDPAARRRPLRDRGDPAPEGRLRGRREGAPRGPLARAGRRSRPSP